MSSRSRRISEDDGYAIIVAVVALAFFAFVALGLTSSTRATIGYAQAVVTRARLRAAVDAGLAAAVHGLAIDNRGLRWTIDGRPHDFMLDDLHIRIEVEDEYGKIPINEIDETQVRAMFELAGASGRDLDIVTDSFLDWRDDDDEVRPNGAEVKYYLPRGYTPRNGALLSLGELLRIRGVTPEIYAKIAPAATIWSSQGGAFNEQTAQPFALSVMQGGGLDSAAVIQRKRELAGQRTAIDISENISLIGHPLTVRVVASDGQGGLFHRNYIIQLTRDQDVSYFVRAIE